MPLPYQASRKLTREIDVLSSNLGKEHLKQRKAIDDDLKGRILEEVVNYLTPYVETIKMFREKGIISEDWRSSGGIKFKDHPLIRGFPPSDIGKLRELFGGKIHYMELDPEEVINNKILLEDLKKRLIDNERINVIRNNATKLTNEVVNSYGTVKYLLTQFPELKEIYSYEYDPTWKPNPNYKIKPRSAFENNNAFVLLLGECAMFGIKP